MTHQSTHADSNTPNATFETLKVDKPEFPGRIPGAEQQMREYLNALFDDDHLVEIRPIECWREAGGKRSRMDRQHRVQSL